MKNSDLEKFFIGKPLTVMSDITGVARQTLRAIRKGQDTRLTTLERVVRPYGKEIEIHIIDDPPEAA